MKAGRIVHEISETLSAVGFSRADRVECEEMEMYVDEIIKWSGRIHLVGKENMEENIRKQVVESALMLGYVMDAGENEDLGFSAAGMRWRVADIGAGAGFPGVVWKILAPEIDMTLFERKRKQGILLERIVGKMGRGGIKVEAGELKAGYQGSFELVVSKASGKLRSIIPLAEAILEEGGLYVTVKGSGWRDEMRRHGCGKMVFSGQRELAVGYGDIVAFQKKS